MRWRGLAVCSVMTLAGVLSAGVAQAHDFGIGSVRIDHPYALPAAAGQTGRVYFRSLKNLGRPDQQLVAARSPVSATAVVVGAHGAAAPISVPGRSVQRYKHDQAQHIALPELAQALREGDEFPLQIEFGGLGVKEISVVVQQPKW